MKQLLLLFSLIWLAGCSQLDDDSKKYEIEEMEELFSEIISLSESVPCTNSGEWFFTPMGSKACGGPTLYLAYHQSVAEEFLNLVEQYTMLQAEYNQKHNVISDCALLAAPISVTCEGGKPVLVY